MFKKADLVIYPPIVLFLAYLIVSSAVVSLFFMDFLPLKVSGFYRVEGRFIVQLIMTVFFQFSLFFVIINYVKNQKVNNYIVKNVYVLGRIIMKQLLYVSDQTQNIKHV